MVVHLVYGAGNVHTLHEHGTNPGDTGDTGHVLDKVGDLTLGVVHGVAVLVKATCSHTELVAGLGRGLGDLVLSVGQVLGRLFRRGHGAGLVSLCLFVLLGGRANLSRRRRGVVKDLIKFILSNTGITGRVGRSVLCSFISICKLVGRSFGRLEGGPHRVGELLTRPFTALTCLFIHVPKEL